MAVQFKPGVNMRVVPQILAALSKIENIFAQHGFIPVVTSANDSSHSPGSLHYIGAAIDIRSKGLPFNVKNAIYAAMKSAFPTPPWYILLEDKGGYNEHYHLQHGLVIKDQSGNVVGYTTLP